MARRFGHPLMFKSQFSVLLGCTTIGREHVLRLMFKLNNVIIPDK